MGWNCLHRERTTLEKQTIVAPLEALPDWATISLYTEGAILSSDRRENNRKAEAALGTARQEASSPRGMTPIINRPVTHTHSGSSWQHLKKLTIIGASGRVTLLVRKLPISLQQWKLFKK